jgi:gliding motility-associated-like protein
MDYRLDEKKFGLYRKMKDIGSFFKERLSAEQTTVPEKVWQKIAQNKVLKRYNHTKKLGKFLPVVCLITLVIISLSYFKLFHIASSENNSEKHAIISKNIIEKKQDSITLVIQKPIEKEHITLEQNPQKSIEKTAITKTSFSEPVRENTVVKEKADPIAGTIISASKTTAEQTIDRNEDSNIILIEKKTPPAKQYLNIEEISEDISTEDIDNISELNKTEEILIVVPSAFTPNADGLNDEWKAEANTELSDFELFIYDRGGQVVFQSRDIYQAWNGEFRGRLLNSNVFIYHIRYIDKNGKQGLKKGTLLLVR